MTIADKLAALPRLLPPSRFNSSDETARADAYMCQLDAIRARLSLALEVLEQASAHVVELRDAWQRGTIEECDGKGGMRSNRNVDVDVAIHAVLEAMKELR